MTTIKIFAAALAVVAATSLAPAAMALGPKASSENFIPGSADAADIPAAATIGPKLSSENFIPPQANPQTTGRPHYVLEGGYVHGGKWRNQWVLVR